MNPTEDEVISDLMGSIRAYGRGAKRALRYQLEDDYGSLFPSKSKTWLIPKSVAAQQCLDVSAFKGKHLHGSLVALGLTYEHMVPLSVLGNLLVGAQNHPREVKRILEGYYQVCWLTKEEDRKLNSLGLKSKMPDGWKDGDPLDARYRHAGIELSHPWRR
jgi:hypothetical protein